MTTHTARFFAAHDWWEIRDVWREAPDLRRNVKRALLLALAVAAVMVVVGVLYALSRPNSGDVLVTVPMAFLTVVLSLGLVPVVASLLLMLVAIPTAIVLPLLLKYWTPRPMRHDCTDLEEHMHIPEENANFLRQGV